MEARKKERRNKYKVTNQTIFNESKTFLFSVFESEKHSLQLISGT